jgi:hypothetical protein
MSLVDFSLKVPPVRLQQKMSQSGAAQISKASLYTALYSKRKEISYKKYTENALIINRKKAYSKRPATRAATLRKGKRRTGKKLFLRKSKRRRRLAKFSRSLQSTVGKRGVYGV